MFIESRLPLTFQSFDTSTLVVQTGRLFMGRRAMRLDNAILFRGTKLRSIYLRCHLGPVNRLSTSFMLCVAQAQIPGRAAGHTQALVNLPLASRRAQFRPLETQARQGKHADHRPDHGLP